MTRRDIRFGRFKQDHFLETSPLKRSENFSIHKLSPRDKRDTLDHLEKVVKNVEHQIHGLKVCRKKMHILSNSIHYHIFLQF